MLHTTNKKAQMVPFLIAGHIYSKSKLHMTGNRSLVFEWWCNGLWYSSQGWIDWDKLMGDIYGALVQFGYY